MNKKTNTLLFVLGGTLFNILITVLSFISFLVIYSKFLYPHFPESSAAWALPIIFVASILVSFLVYRQAVKILIKKVNMEKYFDPIFHRKGSRPKQ